MSIKKRLAAKARMIPDKGFNLVGVDTYEEPGSELYLVGNFPSVEAAESEKKQRLKTNAGEVLHIYSSVAKKP